MIRPAAFDGIFFRRILVVALLLALAVSPALAADEPIVLYPQEGEFFDPVNAGDGSWPYFHSDGACYGFEDNCWDGCSMWCAVSSSSREAFATSELAPQGDYVYAPGNLIDYNRDTVWVEGADGDGIGQSIFLSQNFVLHNENNQVTYHGICIVNGYARSQDAWRANGRVKRLIVYRDTHYLCDLLLNDTMKPQFFDLSELNVKAASGEFVTFRLMIADVYPGEQYADTAITGVDLGFITPNH